MEAVFAIIAVIRARYVPLSRRPPMRVSERRRNSILKAATRDLCGYFEVKTATLSRQSLRLEMPFDKMENHPGSIPDR